MIIDVDKRVTGNIRSPNNIGGSISGGGGSRILVNTTAGWDARASLIAAANTVYVYSDHIIDERGRAVPAFKVGDGVSFLIDLAFDDALVPYKSGIHLTDAAGFVLTTRNGSKLTLHGNDEINYEELYNKPKINDVPLVGNKTSNELKLQDKMEAMTVSEIEKILYL